ncbi:lysophospholipid acyltransferase family protein [Vallicoccus soli]|uniref:1-acyl-sn-glycerol-3-phosphate acyltransferase n=1 Tax=Vallicoccus soli TaxID=2339232 RepID=A0A3A3ZAW9_9ACTN|nr:lysophospholipid acyltransferase family protein [Vallicoccus soli]RJK98236.1 1-acyl-sn-glycerol-3-phosphate acyltransferase [Vallicoccus soli]
MGSGGGRRRRERARPALRVAVALVEPLLLLLTRRDWQGGEHVPRRGGVVLCPNHLSHVDPLTFAHFLWRQGRSPRFLAKESLFRAPVLGAVMRGAEQIPVLRGAGSAGGAYAAALEALRGGAAVCVYPEGTITRDPDGWPMLARTGAARLGLETGAPVVPVAQWGPQELLPPYTLRLRLRPRTLVHVHAGPPVPLDDLRGRPVDAELLAEAARRITDATTALLARVRGEAPPPEPYDPRRHAGPLPGGRMPA